MDSKLMLRKLEPKEESTLNRNLGKNFISTFRVESSRLDLFAHLDQVKAAIQKWKCMHTFLRAKIVQQQSEHFFVLNENSSANLNLENVYFIRRFKRSSSRPIEILDDRKFEALHNLIVEKCLVETIDSYEGAELLWKMIFLEIKPTEYEVFLQYHHDISDGISCFRTFVQLLQIIESYIDNKPLDESFYKEKEIFPGVEECFKEIRKLPFKPFNGPEIEIPEFINPTRAKENSFKEIKEFDKADLESFELIEVDSNKHYSSLGELLEISRINNTKTRRIPLDANLSSRLIAKCKKEKVRLTACFNTIICWGLSRLYKKYGTSLTDIVNYLSISMRQYQAELLTNDVLGYAVGGLFFMFNYEEKSFDFWSMARKSGEELADRVKNDNAKFSTTLPKNSNYYFILSNIGTQEYAGLENGPFKITQSTITTTMRVQTTFPFFVHHIVTVDKQIFWIMVFNSFFTDHFIADDLMHIYEEIFGEILS
jgi:hypothetical protein